MTITPFPKQILIKPVLEKTVLDQEGSKCLYGEVVAVGEGVTKAKVGEILGYEKWGIKTLPIKEEEFDFIHEDSDFLLCKIVWNS